MSVVGQYRRTIELITESDVVRGDLEDDFHHFQVSITHRDGAVVAVDGEAVRHPWSTCPDALGPLQSLVGVELAATTELSEHVDPRQNCTHWFDLAGLAMAQAAAGRARRRYVVTIPDRGPDLTTVAHLDRDGTRLLDWTVDARTVMAPDPYSGRSLSRGFLGWAGEHLDPDAAEAAAVLRRSCLISLGRMMDLDDYDRASELGEQMAGTCHTFTPGVMETALRIKGSSRD